ncbi:hypothetical protein RRG08_049415 [Elysia crispata]|uniref:Uncharacterized protein n=1 Tax=Elysia crispata TaxID=231223 RepID=A0AAE1DKV6_9GAST|nr:hypothetical protein RRG08_049415 [Elysia crispata]
MKMLWRRVSYHALTARSHIQRQLSHGIKDVPSGDVWRQNTSTRQARPRPCVVYLCARPGISILYKGGTTVGLNRSKYFGEYGIFRVQGWH